MKNKWREYIQSLFKRKSLPPEVPFLHEPIDYKNTDFESVRHWVREYGEDYYRLIRDGYRNVVLLNKSNLNIQFKESQYSNGFVIPLNTIEYKTSGLDNLLLDVVGKLLFHHYIVNLAEKKSRRRNDNVELITKYYLKPSLRKQVLDTNTGKVNQIFGNITIEYIQINNKPDTLRLLAQAYNDSKYDTPKDFAELIETITSS